MHYFFFSCLTKCGEHLCLSEVTSSAHQKYNIQKPLFQQECPPHRLNCQCCCSAHDMNHFPHSTDLTAPLFLSSSKCNGNASLLCISLLCILLQLIHCASLSYCIHIWALIIEGVHVILLPSCTCELVPSHSY